MNVQKKIEKWYRNKRFVHYVNERVSEEIRHVSIQRPDPKYKELDEAFDRDNRYVIPLTTYLTYRLQVAKLQKNGPKRRRDIWWVFVQIIILELYTEISTKEFEKLRMDLLEAIMPILHDEYIRLSNKKKTAKIHGYQTFRE